jgi:hypothetical protein
MEDGWEARAGPGLRNWVFKTAVEEVLGVLLLVNIVQNGYFGESGEVLVSTTKWCEAGEPASRPGHHCRWGVARAESKLHTSVL